MPDSAGVSHLVAGAVEYLPHKQPVWAAERLRILTRIFRGIDQQVANGRSVTSALDKAAKRWANRAYRSAPDRKVNLSFSTVDRLYHAWVRGGRDIRVVDLKYKAPHRIEVSPDVLANVLGRAGQQDIRSFGQLFRAVCNESAKPLPSWRTIGRAIPARKRQAMGKLLRARRQATSAERQARKILGEEAR
jgi:hypothetical protein